ncbi:MAG: phosphatase PAP2 family protein [Gemmatimonadetes bacterium]|nr:phosphatase PAP2 family protein [Gemmatimonadota bacterium]
MTAILHRPLGLAGLYLLVTAPTLLPGPWTTGHVVLAGLHFTVCALCLQQAHGPEDLGWLSSWAALILIPLFYTEIALLNQSFGAGYHDSLVLSWEGFLFGSPATELAGKYPYPLLSESLHLAYFSYYPTVYIPPLILFFSRRHEAFQTTVVTLLATASVCFVFFVYFPVQGPRYFGPPESIPEGPIRALTLFILENGSSRGAAFPSSHMAMTVCQAMVQLRYQPPIGILVTLISVGVGVGAVYGGFHYAIDMLAGAVVGLVVGGITLTYIRRSDSLPGAV